MASISRIGDNFTFHGFAVAQYHPGINNVDTSRRNLFPMSDWFIDIPYAHLVEFDSTLIFVNRKIIISNHGWEIIIVCSDDTIQIQSLISTDIPAMRAKFTYILNRIVITLAPIARRTIQEPVSILASIGTKYTFHSVQPESNTYIFDKETQFLISSETLILNNGDSIEHSQFGSAHNLTINGYGYKIIAIFDPNGGNIRFCTESYLDGNHAIHADLVWMNFQEIFANIES